MKVCSGFPLEKNKIQNGKRDKQPGKLHIASFSPESMEVWCSPSSIERALVRLYAEQLVHPSVGALYSQPLSHSRNTQSRLGISIN
jgi:hypothetical protein